MAGAIGIETGGVARVPGLPRELRSPAVQDDGSNAAAVIGVAGNVLAQAARAGAQNLQARERDAVDDRRRQADIQKIQDEEDNRQIRQARGAFNAGVIGKKREILESDDDELGDLGALSEFYSGLVDESLSGIQSPTARQALSDEFLQTAQVEAAKGLDIATVEIRRRQGLKLNEGLNETVVAARDANEDEIIGLLFSNSMDIQGTNLIEDSQKPAAMQSQDRLTVMEYMNSLRRRDQQGFIEEVNSGRLDEFLNSTDIDTFKQQSRSSSITLLTTERDLISQELQFRGDDYNNPVQHMGDGLRLLDDFSATVLQFDLDTSDPAVRKLYEDFGIDPGGIDAKTGKKVPPKLVGFGQMRNLLVRKAEAVTYAQAVTNGEKTASSAPVAVKALDDYFTNKELLDILEIENPAIQGLRMAEIRKRYQFVPSRMIALLSNDPSFAGLVRYTSFRDDAQRNGIPPLLASTTDGIYGIVSQRIYDISERALQYMNSQSANVNEAVVLAVQDIDQRVPGQYDEELRAQLSGAKARSELSTALKGVVTELEGGRVFATDPGEMPGLPVQFLKGRYQINFRRTGNIESAMALSYRDMKVAGWKFSQFRGKGEERWMRFDPQEIDEYRDTDERGPQGFYHEEQMVTSIRQIYRRVGINLDGTAFDPDKLSLEGFEDPRDGKPSYHVIWNGELDIENNLFPGTPIGWPIGSGGGMDGTPISLRPDNKSNPRVFRRFVEKRIDLGEFGGLATEALKSNTDLIDLMGAAVDTATLGLLGAGPSVALNSYASVVDDIGSSTGAARENMKTRAALILVLKPSIIESLGPSELNTEIMELAEKIKRDED